MCGWKYICICVNLCVAKGELCCCYCCWEQSSSCQAVSQGRFRLPFASAVVAASDSASVAVAVAVVVQVKAMRLVQQPSTHRGKGRGWKRDTHTHARIYLAWQVAFCHCLRAASAIFMLVSVRQAASEAADKLCIQHGVQVCARVCVPVCVVEFFHHYQCPCCHCCCCCCGCCGCHMPLNANAARSTFACRLRLLWRHNCMPRPQSAPEREEGEREERRAHRAWPLYSSIFVCRISWHFSVRRQLLPVSVSFTLAPTTPNPPVRTPLSAGELCLF